MDSNESSPSSVDSFLKEQAEMNRDRAEMLSSLLEQTITREGQFVAFASSMGRTAGSEGSDGAHVPSFTVLHSLEWISSNIRLGSEMPFLENKIDSETGR